MTTTTPPLPHIVQPELDLFSAPAVDPDLYDRVKAHLCGCFGKARGKALTATWLLLALDPGSGDVGLSPRTYKAHVADLAAAGCSLPGKPPSGSTYSA